MSAIFIDCNDAAMAALDGELRAIAPDLAINRGRPTAAELPALLAGHRAALVFNTPLPDAVLAAAPALEAVVYLSTGPASYIDIDAAARRGIRVRGVRGYGDRAVAEHALALALAGVRGVARMDRDIRNGRWRAWTGFELAGRTLGIVGLGGTGRALAAIGAALGMTVIGWNRSAFAPGLACRRRPLDAVFAEADVVSLHLALTPDTRAIVDRRRLALMRPHAVLVNTARGGLIDEAALVASLRAGRPGHAALDVVESEPLSPRHPLRLLENVTLTAHAAYDTGEAMARLLRRGLETLRDECAAGRAPRGVYRP